jgi:hypothetical protein
MHVETIRLDVCGGRGYLRWLASEPWLCWVCLVGSPLSLVDAQIADLQAKVEKTETERLRMEAEARDSSDQLREMAEKVFQLLERLKLVGAQ